MKKNILGLAFGVILSVNASAQGGTVNYKRVNIGNYKQLATGVDISPDGKLLAISCVKDFPVVIFDWEQEKTVQEFDVGNWYGGSSLRYSTDGRYLLLNQLYYIDFAVNKDREVTFELVDAATGEKLKRFDAYHAVTISPDSKYAISLTGEEVAFWNLPSGKKEKSFKVQLASNGLAISPDGKYIAISHRFTDDELKDHPRFKKDKKALKSAVKFKQKISVYDASDFTLLYTVDELYDIVYRLEYAPDGKTLFCLQIPHLKAQATGSSRQTYISTIDGVTGEPFRRGFTSQAIYEPEFKLSHDGKLFAVVSKGARFLEIHVYNFETGQMIDRFEQSYRLIEKSEGEVIGQDPRCGIAFLPGDEMIVMTMGNHLIYWDFKQ